MDYENKAHTHSCRTRRRQPHRSAEIAWLWLCAAHKSIPQYEETKITPRARPNPTSDYTTALENDTATTAALADLVVPPLHWTSTGDTLLANARSGWKSSGNTLCCPLRLPDCADGGDEGFVDIDALLCGCFNAHGLEALCEVTALWKR